MGNSLIESVLNTNQNPVKPVDKPEAKSLITNVLNNIKPDHGTDIQLGQYGVGESKYDTNVTPENVTNLNEIRAQKQGILDKWGNGITKAAGVAGTAILENTAGLLYGIADAVSEGDASKLYNNGFTQSLDQFNNYVQKNMPNYYTKAEQDYNLLQKLGTANFWSDSALNGAAYMGSAIVTGIGLNKYASLAKLVRAGKAIDEAELMTKGAKYLDDAARGIKIADAIDFDKNAVLMSHAESAQEARQTYNDTKNQLVTDYKKKFGEDPNDNAMQDIEKSAKAAGNWGYATNLAITGTTNALLFPKMLSEGYGANKAKLNNIELEGGKYIAETEDLKSGISKEIIKGSLEEGGQELAQLLTQKTLTDYYSQGYKDKKDQHDLVGSLVKGLTYTLGSEEGLENFFLGALMGGPAGGIQARREVNQQNQNTQYVAQLLNNPQVKKTVNTFDNFVRATNYEKDKNEALANGSKFDYLNAEFNQNKSIAKQFIDNGAKELLVNQYQDMKSMPEDDFKKVAGYPEDEKLPKSQTEIIDNAIKLVNDLDKTNTSVKELFPYSKEKYENPERYKVLTDNLWHYSTSIDNINKRVRELQTNVFKIASDKSVNITGDGISTPFAIEDNPLVAQQINQINSDLEVAKAYKDKLVESYKQLSEPKTQNKALEDIIGTAQEESTKSENEPIKTPKNDQEVQTEDQIEEPKKVETDHTLNDAKIAKLNDDEELALENAYNAGAEDEVIQGITDHYQSEREKILGKKQKDRTVDDFVNRLSNGEKLNTPEDLQFYDNNKEEIENKLNNLVKETKEPNDTALEQSKEQVNKPDIGMYGTAGFKRVNPFGTTGGSDNDTKPSETRYFRFLGKSDNIKEGTSLLVVTKANKPHLYQNIMDLDPTAKEFESKNPDYKGIYTIFVNNDDELIKADQEGNINPNGEIVFSTLLSPEGIDNTDIPNKEQAKEDLKELRDKLLSEKGDIYLPIQKVSNGVLVRETINGIRKFNPVLGHITNDLSREGLLQLPTISSQEHGITQLKNGQTGLAGKLYAFDNDNNAIDLIPRVLTQDESLLVTNLLSQRLGLIEKNVENPSAELDKFILFGLPTKGANDYTLGVKGDNVYIGKQEFPIKGFDQNKEAHEALNLLLANKHINVSSKIQLQDSFKEPVLKQDHTISYKDWNTYQEYLLSNENNRLPLFGTDVPSLDKPHFRNHYVIYEPIIIRNDIKVNNSQIKEDNTSAESTDLQINPYGDIDLNQDIQFYPQQFTTIAYDKNLKKWLIKVDEELAIGSELKFKKDGWNYYYADWMDSNKQYARYKLIDKNVKTEYLTKEEYNKAKGNIDDNPFAPKEISFEEAKKYWENYKKSQGIIKEFVKKLESKTEETEFKKSGKNRKINLDRLKEVLRTKSRELSNEEKEWFKTQFPGIPIENVKGLIDNNSFGRFISNGKVLLSDLAPENTLRHEAFHVVTQLYLTPKEIKDIYSETRNRMNLDKNKEFSKLSKQEQDKEVEEILAEDFANYKDTGSILGGRELTRNIFQKILDFIKKLIGISNTQIRDIYNKIESNQYLGKQIVGNNQFRTLDKSLPNKTEEFSKETLDGVDYEFFDILFENGFTPEKLFQVHNLTTEIYDRVKDSIIDRYELARKENNTNAIENYKYILNNWDTKGGVLELHNARVKSLGIELTKGENEKTGEIEPNTELTEDPSLITEESIVEDENKLDRSGEAFQNANTISTKDIMFKQTKLFIRTLPKVNKSGQPILNSLGFPQLVDFNSTYNYLLKNLAGISNYPDQLEKIKELSNKKPEFKILLDRILGTSDSLSYEQLMFQNQFRQDFDKNQAVSYLTLVRADGVIYSIDATREFTSGKVKELWRNNLKSGLPLIKLYSDGKFLVDKDILKIKDNIEFLSNLGITFSNETLPALENNEKYTNAVEGIRKYVSDNKLDITNLFDEKSDAKGNMNVLLDLEAQYTPDVTELSFVSTEGKTVYSISLNNYMSIVKNIINNSKTKEELFSKVPHLNTVYNQNSVWMKELFDKNGKKRKDININLDLLDGLKTQDTTEKSVEKAAKKTTSLSAGDRLVQEINNLLNDGKTAVIRTSDKSTEFALSLSKYNGNNKLAVSTESLKDNFNNDKLKDIFRGYFKDELQAIYELEINGLGADIAEYRDNRTKFGIFNDFPSSTEWKNEIKSTIEVIKSSGLSNIEEQTVINQLYNQLIPSIDNSIIRFFENYSEELKNTYETYGVTEKSKVGINKELIDKYSFDQMIRSLAVNDFINSTEQIKLFIGDMSFYKDLFKRVAATTGTGKTARVDNFINSWLNKNIERKDGKISDGKINVLVFEDSKQSSNYLPEYISNLAEQFKKDGLSQKEAEDRAEQLLESYKKMDEGDAQGWITLDEYREFFIRTGDWHAEKIIDKALNGEMLISEEIKYIMPIKAVYFGPQSYEGLYAPAYHKYSLMPLIPQLVKGKNLESLLDNMTKTKTGYAVFKSGSKVGTLVDDKGNANKFYTNTTNGEINNEDLRHQVIDYRYLKIQLDIAPKLKKEVIFGTQFRKLLFSNLYQEGKELFSGAEELFNEYTGIFDSLITSKKQELIKELGINPESYKQEDVKKLVALLKKSSEDRNLADNIIDALQTEEINGNIILKYNFDSMVNKAKIDSMIMSLVNSRLIRQMMNGDAMIQGSSTGFEDKGKRVKGSNDLKFYRKDKNGKTLPMEVKVPLTGEYQHLLKSHGSIENINRLIKEGKLNDKRLTLVGYRIPTQGLNSIEFMKIQEFLTPESGNLIILPTEIVAKSGGDFDIDKLNVFRPFLNPKNEDQIKQNRIIEIAKEVLEHEYNFSALITPNSTHLLTDIVKKVRYIEYVNKKEEDNRKHNKNEKPQDEDKYNPSKQLGFTNQLKLTTKIDQFVKFLGGKAGVGIGALQNTHHILAQIANLSINNEYIDKFGDTQPVNIYFPHNKTEDGRVNLSRLKDVKNDNNISEVISQVINASVDIAKDPFMFDLNMNLDTLSTYLYLVRTGVEFEQIAYFMKQPIITDFLKDISINKSVFLKAAEKSKTEEAIVKDLKDKYEAKLQSKLKLDDQAFDTYMESFENRYDITSSELKSYLSNKNQDSVAFYHTQLQALDNYREYKEQAGMLSEAINSVNHDTAGLGSNINDSRNKEEQKENVEKSGFLVNNDNIYKNTFVGSFDQHKFTIDAYSQFYSTQKEEIVKNNKELLNTLTNAFTKTTDKNRLATLIDNDFINYVVQNYGYNASIKEVSDKLFKGDNSVAKQLLRLKTDTNLTTEEKKLKDNILIKALQPILAGKDHLTTDNIKMYSKRIDTFTSNQLTESFREINDLNLELGKNLMDLSILQSGLNNSAITFMGIVPFEYYGDLVKNAFKEFDKKNGASELYKFNQLFVRNNSKDSVVKFKAKKLELGNFTYKDFQTGLTNKVTKNALGDGMYGKLYDNKLYESSLFSFRDKLLYLGLAQSIDNDYLPAEIENSNNDIEDYNSSEEDQIKALEAKESNQKDSQNNLEDTKNNVTFDNKKVEEPVIYSPKEALKDAKYIHYNKESGEFRSEIHNMALASKELKSIREEFPNQLEVKIVNRQYRIKILEQTKVEFNQPTVNKEFSFDEQEYTRYADDINDSDLTKEQKEELISDLNKVDSEESLGALLKKFCNL